MAVHDKNTLETRLRYTLYEKFASGGMATLHLGLQTSPLGLARVVAIKQLRPEHAENEEFVAMFRDEVRVASRVVHPNVVSILDVVSADDRLLLVMDYVHGLSVADLLRSAGRPMPPHIAATIMVGVLHGLHAAHEACSGQGDRMQIIHRDVTPQNVIVGVDGTPRVLDFGIAHAMGRLQTSKSGQIKGKLAYMAPEQLGAGPIDRRVDVYSSSVMLWEMLCGRRRLFSVRGERQAAVPPSVYQSGVSGALDAIVRRGLENDPERRFSTALEMAIALEEESSLVSATQLGNWVRRLWGDGLEVRARQIAAIESGSRPAPAPIEGTEQPDGEAVEAWDAGHEDPAPVTVVARSPVARSESNPRSTRLGAIARRGALGIAAVAGILFVPLALLRWNASQAPAMVVQSSQPARFMPLLVPLSPETEAEPKSAPAIEADNAAGPRLLPSHSEPRSTPKRIRAHSMRRKSRRGIVVETKERAVAPRPGPVEARPLQAAAKPDCSPPFVIDGMGIKHFKLECLD
jgi:serine/threonine protein kinase